MPQALIALGANQPGTAIVVSEPCSPRTDTEPSVFEALAANLDAAVSRLAATPGIHVNACSRWHRTAPAGGPPGQPTFLNGAVRIETDHEPLALLDRLQAIEHGGGRQRLVHWGPRTIDLDLLLYDDLVLSSPRLELPHPRLGYRRFVLEPAAEIAADWRHPLIGWTISELARHAAAPLNLVVVLGPDRSALATIIQTVLTRVPGDWLRDPGDSARLPPSEIDQARRQCLLVATRSATLNSRPLLCDFWPSSPLGNQASLGRDALALPTPKLWVGIMGRNSPVSSSSVELRQANVDGRRDTNPNVANEDTDDRWRRWLTRPDRGPWLLIETAAIETAAIETAAIETATIETATIDRAVEELAGAIESFL